MKTRTVPVVKGPDPFRFGDRVYFDRQTRTASRKPGDATILVGHAAQEAGVAEYTLDVRIPIAAPKDLKIVQCCGTGRETADGREIVEPILVCRQFRPTDRPQADRHPVEFLEEVAALRAAKEAEAQRGKGAKETAETAEKPPAAVPPPPEAPKAAKPAKAANELTIE